jgi:hypothetical protein
VSEHARLERGDGLWLVSLLLVGCLALAAFTLNARASAERQGDTLSLSEGGVPLDDAWIHFQFARNLARGDGLCFNPGQPTSGSTAPLWTFLLAAVYLAGGRFPIAGEVLSAACYLAMLAATYALGKQLTGRRWAAWLAGMVVALNGRTVWAGLSALEICLFAALSLVAIGMHLTDRSAHRYRLRTAALFGLAALSRPEGYLLFALSVADHVWGILHATDHKLRFPRDVLRIFRQLPLLPILLFVAIISPYLLFSYYSSGHLLPNTYRAKAAFGLLPNREFRDFLGVGATYLILDNPLLLPFFLFGLILLIRHAPLLSLWCIGLPLAYAFLRASLYQHGRYLMPLIPCNAVVAAWGLLEAEKQARRRGWWHWPTLLAPARHPLREQRGLGAAHTRSLAALASLLIIMGTAWRLPEMASLYARNVEDINRMHVALGHWVKENTPPDAILALNDIGAIAYISERPVIDLAGLVTPEVTPAMRAPEQTDQLVAFLAERNAAYVIIFPNWFPGLAARSDVLEEVHHVTLNSRTITGGETMVVYRAHWRR